MKKILLIICYLWALGAKAQFADSLQVQAGAIATAATQGYQPLWIVANRYGTLTDQQADLATHLSLSNEHLFSSQLVNRADGPPLRQRGFYLQYKAEVYNNQQFQRFFLAEGYLKVGYRNGQLRAGRYRETIGEMDPMLSSGSLGLSSNALPVPKVDFAVVEYTPVPFTKGFVQFKGQLAHGWFAASHGIEGVYLHQKSLYLRAGRERWQFHAGLTHFAQWGGNFASGPAPSRFKDYLRVFVGASADRNDPVYYQGPPDLYNAVGNHLLIPEFGFTVHTARATFRLYTQTIFDRGVSDSADARDRLAGLKILRRDRLLGLSWERATDGLLQKIVLEGLYTKHQGGPIPYIGRDNYYNNAIYQMGWQYQGQILGTPLFLNEERAQRYGLDPEQFAGGSILSNRVVGVHVGVKGTLLPRLHYRFLGTYVQHYGNYYDNALFPTAKQQTHFLLELPYRWPHAAITAAIGGDYGDLSRNAAGLLRLEWYLR